MFLLTPKNSYLFWGSCFAKIKEQHGNQEKVREFKNATTRHGLGTTKKPGAQWGKRDWHSFGCGVMLQGPQKPKRTESTTGCLGKNVLLRLSRAAGSPTVESPKGPTMEPNRPYWAPLGAIRPSTKIGGEGRSFFCWPLTTIGNRHEASL